MGEKSDHLRVDFDRLKLVPALPGLFLVPLWKHSIELFQMKKCFALELTDLTFKKDF